VADIHQRKRDHIELCNTGDVQAADHGGLFGEVTLVHDAMPELAMDELDLATRFLDHTLRAPLMITGMTGGPSEAGDINRGLARLCGELGLAFGVGSQRVITKDAASLETFRVRDVAPDVVLLGNLGINQARDLGPARVTELVKVIGADYLAIHLNPAMELVQPGAEADSDFRNGYETVARLVEALPVPIVVKECGTGLAPRVVRRLHSAGVRAVDLSGSGGTSWVKVEALRAEGRQHDLGLLFADWGIPTAAAIAMCADVPVMKIASGGIQDGLAVARALALGADVAGFARPVLQAFLAGGADGARAYVDYVTGGLRMAMALTGCRRPGDLARAPRVLGPRLGAWIEQSRRFER
jgi:isopentenyl-diphosphate delta-isomerase